MRFEWHPIRERDAFGRLVAAGVRWTERRDLAQALYLIVALLALMGTVAAFLVHLASPRGGSPGVALLLLALFISCVVAVWRMRGRTRALVFHQDGSTKAPFGFAHYHRSSRELTTRNWDFVSIEARGQGDTDCTVAVFTRGGDVGYVAGFLHRDQAHKVAVQLTHALAELRESIGNDGLPGSRAATGTHSNAETFID